jgi:LTXXQ motif family protein
MTISRVASLFAVALLLVSCEHGPTQPASTNTLDSIDAAALSFNASLGLPGQPFQDATAQHAPADAKDPGAAFPDSIRLTAAQKTAIQSLVDAYAAANATDLAALQAIHAQMDAAMKAGATKAQLDAIMATAAPILARQMAASKALHDSIFALLTPLQQIWIGQHLPKGPPPGWQPPGPPHQP